ncbi:hypothetical protein CRUP_019709 [Coryphaenoides rupestris]|nr:hypothetical protein CRUP_019709 [Coryphaenoides rupestris]
MESRVAPHGVSGAREAGVCLYGGVEVEVEVEVEAEAEAYLCNIFGRLLLVVVVVVVVVVMVVVVVVLCHMDLNAVGAAVEGTLVEGGQPETYSYTSSITAPPAHRQQGRVHGGT